MHGSDRQVRTTSQSQSIGHTRKACPDYPRASGGSRSEPSARAHWHRVHPSGADRWPRYRVQFQRGLSLPEFLAAYGSEAQCAEAVFRWRWPRGFVFPGCGRAEGYTKIQTRGLLQCKHCRHQTSLTAGTVVAYSKLPLTIWFLALYLLTQLPLPGVNPTMDGSDFHTSPRVSSLSTLVHGCPPPADQHVDLPGCDVLSLSGSTRARTPGSTRVARRCATPVVACRGPNPSALSNDKIFWAQHLQGRLHPLPLHLACFRAYASTRLLPVAPQGSILGSRRTITQAGFPPRYNTRPCQAALTRMALR